MCTQVVLEQQPNTGAAASRQLQAVPAAVYRSAHQQRSEQLVPHTSCWTLSCKRHPLCLVMLRSTSSLCTEPLNHAMCLQLQSCTYMVVADKPSHQPVACDIFRQLMRAILRDPSELLLLLRYSWYIMVSWFQHLMLLSTVCRMCYCAVSCILVVPSHALIVLVTGHLAILWITYST